jgi:DNA repair protein RecN (Recombination protein N)
LLQALSIRNFIIVEALDLDFEPGFTTLTGETGAGKSILIDAMSLALGARNEGDVVRAGCEKAEISTTFHMANNLAATEWLRSNEIEVTDELMLRRVIYADGRSRAFINGIAATVSQLKEVGEFLVDIYSQNAHHSLLNINTQRQILDAFAHSAPLANEVAKAYHVWRKLHVQRIEFEKNAAAYADELADLRDRVRELKQLGFTPEEWQDLQSEHSRLSHGAAILSGGEQCLSWMSEGEQDALSLLAQVQQKLAGLLTYDAQLTETAQAVDTAVIHLQEAARSLNRYLQRADLDPERLNEVELRIQAIHGVSRKYRTRPEELNHLLTEWEARMSELEGFSGDGELARQEAQALENYQQQAIQLSAQRQQFSKVLAEKITAEMQRLSLSGGRFEVVLTPQEKTATGLEQVEFHVAGHAGVEARPLNKVASGGELSRISLALHVTTASAGSVPTMVFDEVDVGIGGGVAEVVGKLLKQLGSSRQVLVITHLAQVAAQAAHHLQVSKTQTNGMTLSHIQCLSDTERIEEIARMSGGLVVTDATRNHAREMLGMR